MNTRVFVVAALTAWSYSFNSIGQTPQAIPYQAVARNLAGEVVASQPVTIRFTIHDSAPGGTIVYSETHSPVTNGLGLFTVNIGQGTVVSGTFSTINWSLNSKFLQVEMDITGGTSFVDLGTQQMLSVPYALYSGGAVETDPQVNPSSLNSVPRWNGTQLVDGQVYDNGTNVGVGTTAPTQKLDVAGSIKTNGLILNTGSGLARLLQSDASGNANWQTMSGDATIGSSGILTLSNTGVAPGTYTKLTVDSKGRASSGTNLIASDLPAGSTSYIQNQVVSDQPAGFRINGNGIFNSGNVGIGTTAPAQRLDVNGTIRTTSLQLTTGAATAKFLQSDISGNASWQTLTGDASLNSTGTITFANSGVIAGTYPKVTVDSKGRVTSGTTLSTADIPSLTGYIQNQTLADQSAGFRINGQAIFNGGNIAIGTTTALSRFDLVAGTITNSGFRAFNVTASFPATQTTPLDAAQFAITSAGSSAFEQRGLGVYMNAGYTGAKGGSALYAENNMVGTGTDFFQRAANIGGLLVSQPNTTGTNVGSYCVGAAGNVSIGTAGFAINSKNFGKNIGVFGSAENIGSSASQFGGYFTLGSATPTIPASVGAALYADNGTDNSPIFIAADNGTEMIRIRDGGNLGLGTTTPANKLDVEGAVAIGAAFSGTNLAPVNGLCVDGSTGIGVSLPASKLDVEGNVSIGASYSGTIPGPANGLIVEGGVGIGNSNPMNKLDVAGGVAIGSNYTMLYTAPANGVLIQGNVGIGNPVPAFQLEVSASSLPALAVSRTFPATSKAVLGVKSDATNVFILGNNSINEIRAGSGSSGGLLNFYTDNTADYTSPANGSLTLTLINGKAGVGTSTPVNKLDVEGGLAVGTTYSGLFFAPANGACFEGSVGIGVSLPASKVDIEGNLSIGNSYSGSFAAPTNGAIIEGNVGIGTSGPIHKLQLGTDDAAKPSTGTWTIISDERLKNIEANYEKGLEEILRLRPVVFHYRNNSEIQFSEQVLSKQCVGFSAQEVQNVFPECVTTDANGYLNLNIHPMIISFVNAFREQQESIKHLEEENAKLKLMNDKILTDLEVIKAQLGITSR